MTEESKSLAIAFGWSQILILILIVGTMAIFFIKQWLRDRSIRSLDENFTANLKGRVSVKRPKTADQLKPGSSQKFERPPGITSTFPNWTSETPPHEILELSPDAASGEIEAAYKKLIKRYHPDRFGGWGADYDAKAHQIVLLIQRARDKMLLSRPAK